MENFDDFFTTNTASRAHEAILARRSANDGVANELGVPSSDPQNTQIRPSDEDSGSSRDIHMPMAGQHPSTDHVHADCEYRVFLEMLATNVLRYKEYIVEEEAFIKSTSAEILNLNAPREDPRVEEPFQEMLSHRRLNGDRGFERDSSSTVVRSHNNVDVEVPNEPSSRPLTRDDSECVSGLLERGEERGCRHPKNHTQAFLKMIQILCVRIVNRSSLLKAVTSHTYEAHHPIITFADLSYMLFTTLLTIVCLDLLSASFFTEHSANNAPKEGSIMYTQHVALLIVGQILFTVWMLMRPLVRKRGRASGRLRSLLEYEDRVLTRDCDHVGNTPSSESNVSKGALGDDDAGKQRHLSNGTFRKQRGFGFKRRLLGAFSSISEWEVLDTPSALWKEYTRTWFWFDLAVTFPWNLPYFLSFGLVLPQSFLAVTSSVHLLRWIRAMTIGRSSEPLIATRRYLRFVRMFCAIISFAHFCALLFPIVNPSLGLSYLASLYYIMTTMTSVGYGDVTPRLTNDNGLAFAIVIMVIGVAAVGIFTASLTQYLNSKHHGQEIVDSMRARLEGQLHGQFSVSREARQYLTEYFMNAVAVREFEDFWRRDLVSFPGHIVAEIEPFILSDLLASALLRDLNSSECHMLSSLPAPSSLMQNQLRSWLRQLAEATVSCRARISKSRSGNITSRSSTFGADTLPIPPRHSHLYRQRFVQGELLFEAGDLLDGLVFVLEGSIDVFVPTMASACCFGGRGSSALRNVSPQAQIHRERVAPNRRSVAFVRAGQALSLLGVFAPSVALASARCVSEKAEVLILSRQWVLMAIALSKGNSDARTSSTNFAAVDNISSCPLGQYLAARKDLLLGGFCKTYDVERSQASSEASVVNQICAVLAGSHSYSGQQTGTRESFHFKEPPLHPICAPLSLF